MKEGWDMKPDNPPYKIGTIIGEASKFHNFLLKHSESTKPKYNVNILHADFYLRFSKSDIVIKLVPPFVYLPIAKDFFKPIEDSY